MTAAQYKIILQLFHEYHEAFLYLPEHIKDGFYKHLAQGAKHERISV